MTLSTFLSPRPTIVAYMIFFTRRSMSMMMNFVSVSMTFVLLLLFSTVLIDTTTVAAAA
jgi:hypothetical protein